MLPKHLGQECPPEVSSPQTMYDLSTIEVTDSDASTGGGTCGNLLKPGNKYFLRHLISLIERWYG